MTFKKKKKNLSVIFLANEMYLFTISYNLLFCILSKYPVCSIHALTVSTRIWILKDDTVCPPKPRGVFMMFIDTVWIRRSTERRDRKSVWFFCLCLLYLHLFRFFSQINAHHSSLKHYPTKKCTDSTFSVRFICFDND